MMSVQEIKVYIRTFCLLALSTSAAASVSALKIHTATVYSFDPKSVVVNLETKVKVRLSRQLFAEELREGQKITLQLTDEEVLKAEVK